MSWNDKNNHTRNQLRGLNKVIPDTARAFGGLSKAVKEGGVLEFKQKEFVALGIAVAVRCDACIGLHVEASDTEDRVYTTSSVRNPVKRSEC